MGLADLLTVYDAFGWSQVLRSSSTLETLVERRPHCGLGPLRFGQQWFEKGFLGQENRP